MGALTGRGRFFLMAGVALVAAGMALGLVDLTAVGALLVVLPVIALLLTSRDLTIEVGRSIAPQRVPIDSPAQVTLTVENTGRRSTPVTRAEETLAYALGDRPRIAVPRLRAGETLPITYPVRSHVRGRHALGPLTVHVSDPFGLTQRSAVHPATSTLTVLPKVVELPTTAGASAGAGGDSIQTHRVALVGEQDPAVRPYRIGDELRRIHWPSTARTGDMMVRQDEEPGHHRALVVVDDRASVHAGTGAGGSFEWMASAAASVVVRLLADGEEVHLALASGNGSIAALESRDHALDILAGLAPTTRTDAAGLVGAITDFQAGGGGSIVAVIGAVGSSDDAGPVMRGSHPIALVIDRGAFQDDADQSRDAARSSAALTAAGWRCVTVGPGSRISELWREVQHSTAGVR